MERLATHTSLVHALVGPEGELRSLTSQAFVGLGAVALQDIAVEGGLLAVAYRSPVTLGAGPGCSTPLPAGGGVIVMRL